MTKHPRGQQRKTMRVLHSPGSEHPDYKGKVHKAILQAAKLLMLSKSLDGISIDEIVKQANVAKGSFYNHFASKEALASEIFEHVRFHASGLVRQSLNDDMCASEQLITGAFVLVRFTVENPASACALINLSSELLSATSPLNNQARTIIQRGFADGMFKNMPVESAIKLVIGMMLIMHQESLGCSWPLTRILIMLSPLAQGLLSALGVTSAESEHIVQRAILNASSPYDINLI